MRKGVAPLVGALIVTIFLISTTVLIGNVVKTQIKKIQALGAFDSGMDAMVRIKDAIDTLSTEGGSRIVNVNIPDGEIVFSPGDNSVYFSSPAMVEGMPRGYRKNINGLIVTSGSDVSSSSDSSSIVLRNSMIEATFSKLGSESSHVPINAGTIISSVMVRKNGKKVHPDLKIFIGGLDESSGTGYVYPVTTGPGLNFGRVVAKVFSQHYNYTIIYTLPSGSDYIDVKIRDIKQNS